MMYTLSMFIKYLHILESSSWMHYAVIGASTTVMLVAIPIKSLTCRLQPVTIAGLMGCPSLHEVLEGVGS